MMFREWTLRETLFVRDYAGTVPLSALSRHLRRDARDVARECARLGVPFVYMGTPLFWCDECASWARRLDRSGRCEKCSNRANLCNIEAETAELLARLPYDQRETYAVTEAERGARVLEPPPPPPRDEGMAPRDAVAAATAYLAARSDWEGRKAKKDRRTAQKRKERIRAKVRALGSGPA